MAISEMYPKVRELYSEGVEKECSLIKTDYTAMPCLHENYINIEHLRIENGTATYGAKTTPSY